MTSLRSLSDDIQQDLGPSFVLLQISYFLPWLSGLMGPPVAVASEYEKRKIRALWVSNESQATIETSFQVRGVGRKCHDSLCKALFSAIGLLNVFHNLPLLPGLFIMRGCCGVVILLVIMDAVLDKRAVVLALSRSTAGTNALMIFLLRFTNRLISKF